MRGSLTSFYFVGGGERWEYRCADLLSMCTLRGVVRERRIDAKDLGDEIPQSTLDRAGFGTPSSSPGAWHVPKRENQGGGQEEESRVAGLKISRVTSTEGKTG